MSNPVKQIKPLIAHSKLISVRLTITYLFSEN